MISGGDRIFPYPALHWGEEGSSADGMFFKIEVIRGDKSQEIRLRDF
jgi:hypothetical protein